MVKPDVYEDARGTNVEIYNDKTYREGGIEVNWIHDSISTSTKHVLRGIHGDATTWKLVSCLQGRIYFVVVNCNEDSPAFGNWESFILSEANRYQILVPPKFGNAHLALTEHVVFHYRWSDYYDLSKQFSYRYDDPRFGIWWPVKNPVLSQRDEGSKK